MEYKIVKQEEAPLEVNKWLEENRTLKAQNIIAINDMTYVLLTMGKKKTGGYEIDVDCKESEDKVEIFIKYLEPKSDQIVIQAITYPMQIISFKETTKEILVIQIES
ncbi:MAG: protease complex subunit PrcB family protein [Vulcanibacillus sp.]